jgi:hypothetical protein
VTEGSAYLTAIPEWVPLTELPNDPRHFVHSAQFVHDVQPVPGGELVTDVTVSWDLRRTLTR